MALLYDHAQQSSHDIYLIFLSENLKMLEMGLSLNPDFACELTDLDCQFSDVLPSQMMEKVLSVLFDQCDLYSDYSDDYSFEYENFCIESELFRIISSGDYLKSEHCERLVEAIQDLSFTISGDISLNCDEDEDENEDIDSDDEVMLGRFLLSLFQDDRLELKLYYTEDISGICQCFIDLKEVLELIKEENYGNQEKLAA